MIAQHLKISREAATSMRYGIKFGKEHVGKTHAYTATASNPAGVATNSFFIKVVWDGPLELPPPPGVPAPTNSVVSTGGKEIPFKRWGINLRENGGRIAVGANSNLSGLNLRTGDGRIGARSDMGGDRRIANNGGGSLASRKDATPSFAVRVSLRTPPSAQRIGLRLGQPVSGGAANIPP